MSDEQQQRLEEFLNRDFDWRFTAGECNFLIQLLAYVVQENPELVRGADGEMEKLNYQSIRSVVLLNEKLSGQLQHNAREASVGIGEVNVPTERVQ